MPSQGQNSDFSISDPDRRFIEATVDPISSRSRPLTESAIALPIHCRRSLTLAALQRWQRELSVCRKGAVPTTQLVLSRRQANLPDRDRLRSRAQGIARMLVAQFVLLLALYVRSFVLLQSSNRTKSVENQSSSRRTRGRRFIP